MGKLPKVKDAETITAWSWSRLQDWETCPLRAKFKYIDKVKVDVDSPFLRRGKDVHDYLQKVANRETKQRRRELRWARELVERSTEGREYAAEAEIALTADWEPTSWFAHDAWLRVRIDLSVWSETKDYSVTVADYKTGKIRKAEHLQQLSLYGLAAFCKWGTERVAARLIYVDHEKILPEQQSDALWHNKQLGDLKDKWGSRALPMLEDKSFDAKPGSACKWCDFSPSRGGKCPEGR
jgi:CRISPR/Cas system-associated exonuclease Cas4 (RecB family)